MEEEKQIPMMLRFLFGEAAPHKGCEVNSIAQREDTSVLSYQRSEVSYQLSAHR